MTEYISTAWMALLCGLFYLLLLLGAYLYCFTQRAKGMFTAFGSNFGMTMKDPITAILYLQKIGTTSTYWAFFDWMFARNFISEETLLKQREFLANLGNSIISNFQINSKIVKSYPETRWFMAVELVFAVIFIYIIVAY